MRNYRGYGTLLLYEEWRDVNGNQIVDPSDLPYLDQFNPGQCKELLEAVVQTVTVEGPTRARLRLDMPLRPLGKFDR